MIEHMTNEEPIVSGNRWEPADVERSGQPTEPPVASPEHAPARPPWLSRTRAAIAGAAAAVLVAGGLGGFAIGRTSAGSERPDGADQRHGVPSDLSPGDDGGDGG